MVSPVYIILALVPVAVMFRYLLEQTQAARVIGVKLASPEFLAVKKHGFQDAVSLPEAAKWFFLVLGLLVAGLAWLALGFGVVGCGDGSSRRPFRSDTRSGAVSADEAQPPLSHADLHVAESTPRRLSTRRGHGAGEGYGALAGTVYFSL
jgi:hypothetical protein